MKKFLSLKHNTSRKHENKEVCIQKSEIYWVKIVK